MDWQRIKLLAETAQSVATSLAILVAGIWTYVLFVRRREKYPRAELSHRIQRVALSTTQQLLHVETRVRNVGQTVVSLQHACTWVHRIAPPDDALTARLDAGDDPVSEGEQQVRWPVIAEREYYWKRGEAEVEPGESESLLADLVIPTDLIAISIYSFIQNHSKNRPIGWSYTTLIGNLSQELEIRS